MKPVTPEAAVNDATVKTPATDDDATVLQAQGLARTFIDGAQRREVLKNASLTVRPGEVVALVGQSGSGKSTLLHLLGLLDRPDSGEIHVAGQATAGLSETRRSAIRNAKIGFVFQHYFLLPEFNVLDNILMAARVGTGFGAWWTGEGQQARDRAMRLLEKVGLGDRATQRPATLSGGERQRVAVARALMSEPKVLLCDEPTGNLDRDTADRIMRLIFELTHAGRIATLVVTHEQNMADRADRVLRLENGKLVSVR